MSTTTTTTRPTVASVAADLAELRAMIVAAFGDAAPAKAAVQAAPTKAAKGKKAKAPKAAKVAQTPRMNGSGQDEHTVVKGVHFVNSRSMGEELNRAGVAEAKIMVPAGRFGRDGHQTLTEARAKTAASEAKRAEYLAGRGEKAATTAKTAEQKAVAKTVNTEMAAHLRSMGVVPTGQAWAACKAGERSAKKLLALNAADGLTAKKAAPVAAEVAPKAAKAAKKAKAPKAPKAEPQAAALSDEHQAKLAKLVAAGFDEAAALDIVSKLA